MATPPPPAPTTSTRAPRDRDAQVVEPLDEADTVEQRTVDRAVGVAPRGVDGLRDRARAVAAVEQRQHRRLVRNRQHQAVDVAGGEGVANEGREVARRHQGGHQHRIDAVAREQVVEGLGRTHLRDRVAQDQEDARACR